MKDVGWDKDELDEWAESLEILNFSLIEGLIGDYRLSVDLKHQAQLLHKQMLAHLFRQNLPSPWNAENIMSKVKLLEIECYQYLISTDQLPVNVALTSDNCSIRKAAQKFHQTKSIVNNDKSN